VNRWVSDKIVAYRYDLSPRLISRSYSRYSGQNILVFATYCDLAADLYVQETFLVNSIVQVYINSNFSIVVDSNAMNQGNTFAQYSSVVFV
jgi:hypothetical protein